MNLFDFVQDESVAQASFKTTEANDWRWSMATDYPKQKNGLTVFSCFACGGGSTMGYKLAGCDVLGCCEIDEKMNRVYVENHHPKYNYLMDIRDFNKLDDLPQELYNLDILDGSPPCTTFSMAGEREESWGKKKKFREGQAEQTLDDLSFVFGETVAKLKPKVVVMENVEGLLLGEAWAYVRKIYKQFSEIGYNLKHWLLCGENMGVPQRRHRVFFVGVLKDINFDLDSIDMAFNYKPVRYKDIKEGTGHLIGRDTKYYHYASLADKRDKSLADTRIRLGEKGSAFQTYYIRDEDIMPTIRSKPDVIDLSNISYISWQTIRNSQTFPQDFNFMPNKEGQVGYICGMSVPPIMIKRVVTRLIESGLFAYKGVV